MEIKVFPDMGHQTVFVPLGAFDDGRLEQVKKVFADLRLDALGRMLGRAAMEQIQKRCANDHTPWRELRGKAWIRYRFGTQVRSGKGLGEVQLYGLWLAIESNLGDVGRGYVVEERPVTEAEREGFQASPVDNVSPYAATEASRLSGRETIDLLQVLQNEKIDLPGRPPERAGAGLEYGELLTHTAVWVSAAGEPLDVDLIVDFGNTRTVVLALENDDTSQGKLRSICRPIHFPQRGAAPDAADPSKQVIVESWIALEEPLFSTFETDRPSPLVPEYISEPVIKRTGWLLKSKREGRELTKIVYRVPQMFVELSPAILGADAELALREKIDLVRGEKAFQSSPKRYAWDTDQGGSMGDTCWSMVLNPWNPVKQIEANVPKLAGEALRFIPLDGRDWDIASPPTGWEIQQRPSAAPSFPVYPRSETLTWAALAILEQAHREITSEDWRRNHKPFIPRRLRKIVVTYPSGWTGSEVAAYRAKWQKAVNIFRHAHLRDPLGAGPTLSMDVDEAIASQLPLIYSEITRLGSVGENYIELIGRKEEGAAKARVLTMDIGGGTTDVAIVDYRNTSRQAGVNLHAELLCKDTSTVAGDALVKRVIERVLLPAIGAPLRSDAGRWTRYARLFGASLASATDKAEWSKISRLVFVTIVRRWLEDRVLGIAGNPQTGRPWTPREIGVHQMDVELFNRKLESLAAGDLLQLDEPLAPLGGYEAIDQCVEECFDGLFQSLAKHVAAFGCDLVIVAGKPSELPMVRDLVVRHMPLPIERILFAKNFDAGDWYPLYDRKIEDAKTVTAVGAALYTAITNGRIAGWDIHLSRYKEGEASPFSRNWWGAMHPVGAGGLGIDPGQFAATYMGPDKEEADVEILVGTVIGRKRLQMGGAPEPVYVLRWRDPQWRSGGLAKATAKLRVTLRREFTGEGEEYESLQAVAVEGEFNDRPVRLEDIELKLCSLAQREFWMETGRFNVPEEVP
jgi:hypothetical protein